MTLGLLQNLSEERIHEICEHKHQESQTLDFKKTGPSTSQPDKREFLKDVCAFANADGGDLVYGIHDVDGAADSIHSIKDEPLDSLKLRLNQTALSGLEPRVVGLTFKDVPLKDGGYILIVRVPQSFNGPHWYRSNDNTYKFVMRVNTNATDMTYDQLRNSFDRTATLTERARRFRDERLSLIQNRKTWKPMLAGPVCVVHLIPIQSMSGKLTIDIPSIYNSYGEFIIPGWGGASRTTNLDGLVVYPGGSSKEIHTYTQIFRSGAIESSRYGGSFFDTDRKKIPATNIADFIRKVMNIFMNTQPILEISGPAIFSAAMVSIGGFEFEVVNGSGWVADFKSDRENVILPDIWIDAFESITNVDQVVKPMLDVLWQAFSMPECNLYDEQGTWLPGPM